MWLFPIPARLEANAGRASGASGHNALNTRKLAGFDGRLVQEVVVTDLGLVVLLGGIRRRGLK